MTRVVVDADYMVYSAGFAVESVQYDVSVSCPDGTEESVILDTRDERDAWITDPPCDGAQFHVEKLVSAEPVANAFHLINRTLSGIESAMRREGIEYDRLELFITGKGNFRDALATIKGYKANRDPAHKPVHYDALRRFLKDRHGAVEVHGYEADDAVAMAAHADPRRTIVVSVDKDLLTVPGRHYNFKKKKFLVVTKRDALVNFYRQLIAGDATDNIGGAYKAGPKAASRITPAASESEMYHYTLELYERGKEYKECPYAHLSAEEALLENARLLHMKRTPEDVWEPPALRVPPGERESTGPGSRGPSPPPSQSPSSTRPRRSASLSLPPGTSVLSADSPRLSGLPHTPLTSGSPVPGGLSRRKGNSPRKTVRLPSRSKSSTPTESTPSSSKETITCQEYRPGGIVSGRSLTASRGP